MNAVRRMLAMALVVALAWLGASAAAAEDARPPEAVLRTWYKLVLELVRHTPTYSPPVASRTFAYLGVTAFESVASGSSELYPLAGQLNGLRPVPPREPGRAYDDGLVLHTALSLVVQELFANTGPTGQRVLSRLGSKLRTELSATLPPDVAARSEAHGKAVADHILAWSRDDGGAAIENMGFPLDYKLTEGPAHWVPTSLVSQQQFPLLPDWGKTRTFATPNGAACGLPPPPEYSEDKTSAFYKEAHEVYQTVKDLTQEQRAIARFWSDDPMLTSTPPGHWLSIALQILERDQVDLNRSAELLARLGVALADSFIGCWDAKFQYNLVRPVTYIRRVIDPKWEAILITPPFPEYPSGHSTQSGAAAVVLTGFFGSNVAFEDATHSSDGIKPRAFPSFWAAANEAGISRLYGGIHYRAAIERGLDQGRCIGAYADALRTRR